MKLPANFTAVYQYKMKDGKPTDGKELRGEVTGT